NVVPRAIILPLQHDCFVAFDTELLRVAAIWIGQYPTLKGLAPMSYGTPLNKAGGGIGNLAKPQGHIFYRSQVAPGLRATRSGKETDPRTAFNDPNEPGKGPLASARYIGTKINREGPVLRWIHNEVTCEDTFSASLAGDEIVIHRSMSASDSEYVNKVIYKSDGTVQFEDPTQKSDEIQASEAIWPATAISAITSGNPQGIYAVDEIEIPYPNPWKRRIRPVDIQFTEDGTAYLLTFDGDVYTLSGISSPANQIEWRRIAAGFNEPMSLRFQGDKLFVFSRLGITQLVDRNGDGETDFYKLFSNDFVQSPGSRDFPSSLIDLPEGGFLIAKGGQQSDTFNPHSGRILKISPQGKRTGIYASGFRNAFIERDPATGLITSSDQQGQWIPSTPFHIVEEGKFYGHEKSRPTPETQIAEPKLWIPHRAAQSGMGQIMGFDDRFPTLQGAALYLDYQKPSVLRISLPTPEAPHPAASPLPIEFQTPALKGSINPQDGFPYFVGFQIWGTISNQLEGISRIRYLGGHDHVPRQAIAYEEGILLQFESPIDTKTALDPNNYQLSSWNYRRTPSYGSPQFNDQGDAGVDARLIHTPFVSQDNKSVFLAIANLSPAMQYEVQSNVFGNWTQTYLTSREFPKIDLAARGFNAIDFSSLFASKPAPRETIIKSTIISAMHGEELYTKYGCISCHSIDGSTEGKAGPTWKGLYKSRQELTDGQRKRVTEDYLIEAILEPEAAKPIAYASTDAGMPSYKGILSDSELQSLILYIKSLGLTP
ncbi:MAG: c-type cytochrome, partial [Verrucomicrobiota bacterium]